MSCKVHIIFPIRINTHRNAEIEEDPVEVYTPGQVDTPPRVDEAADKHVPAEKPAAPAKPAAQGTYLSTCGRRAAIQHVLYA